MPERTCCGVASVDFGDGKRTFADVQHIEISHPDTFLSKYADIFENESLFKNWAVQALLS